MLKNCTVILFNLIIDFFIYFAIQKKKKKKKENKHLKQITAAGLFWAGPLRSVPKVLFCSVTSINWNVAMKARLRCTRAHVSAQSTCCAREAPPTELINVPKVQQQQQNVWNNGSSSLELSYAFASRLFWSFVQDLSSRLLTLHTESLLTWFLHTLLKQKTNKHVSCMFTSFCTFVTFVCTLLSFITTPVGFGLCKLIILWLVESLSAFAWNNNRVQLTSLDEL